MHDDLERFVPSTVYEQGPSGPAPVDIGKALFVAPFSASRTGTTRSKDELVEKLQHVEANSPEEVCEAFDVRITGQFDDGDGVVEVDLPVRGAEDFTADGLVRKQPRLRALFVGSCTADAVARELASRKREALSDAEVAQLEAVVSELDAALETEES